MPAVLYLPFAWPGERFLRFCLPDGTHVTGDHEVSTSRGPVSVSVMPGAELGPHLQGMFGWLHASGASQAARIRAMHSVAAISLEPAAGMEDPVFVQLVHRMLIASDGLLFDGGTLVTRSGASLLDGLPRPSAPEVAARALVLLAVSSRGLLEQSAGTDEQAEADGLRVRIRDWLDRYGLLEACEPEEADVLGRSIGTLAPQETLDAVWRAEGAQVLLWALDARPLPPHDAQEHPYQVSAAAGLATDGPGPLLEAPTLRDAGAIDALHRTLQGLHWRFRQQSFDPGPVDFAAFATRPPLGPFSLDGIALVDDDLAVSGVPVHRADATFLSLCSSIARERHVAANWLIGVNPIYSHVDTPT